MLSTSSPEISSPILLGIYKPPIGVEPLKFIWIIDGG